MAQVKQLLQTLLCILVTVASTLVRARDYVDAVDADFDHVEEPKSWDATAPYGPIGSKIVCAEGRVKDGVEDIINDDFFMGQWDCPWRSTLRPNKLPCPDGTYTCRCPGTYNTVYYTIKCSDKSPVVSIDPLGPTCGCVLKTDIINYTCRRYQNCAVCRSGTSSDNIRGACAECELGYAHDADPLLRDYCTDVNECMTDNGGCHPEPVASCTNTMGSYFCTCGHGHELMADGHECNRLACPTPKPLPPVMVEDTESWLYMSYAKYSCLDKSTHSLVGATTAECLGVGEQVMWSEPTPKCFERCKTTNPVNHCGLEGITEEECKQRDCCFVQHLTRCEHSEAQLTLLYKERRPLTRNGQGFFTQEQGAIDGCGTMATILTAPYQGKAFGIHHLGYNVTHDVNLQDCHVFEMNMDQYEDLGEMGEADDFDFYDMLEVEPDVKADNRDYHDLEKILEGCYLDDDNDPDLDRIVWSRDDNTVSKCIAACRQQNFQFAGLQNGRECHCGNTPYRHGNDTICDIPCTGATSQTCGGTNSNSIYRVPYDHRYIGCYKDTEDIPDLPEKLWDKDSGKSAVECIDECMLLQFDYAGVQDGGACFCGYAFGHHGDAREEDCDQTCGQSSYWGDQNCGGEETNAIYNTELMVHATEVVAAPAEDKLCADNCYEPCGDLYESEGTNDVILRFFHINLSDLHLHTGTQAERVYVYAQSVVIDEDIHVEYSLQVRTRQLFIDRSTARWITASIHAPALDLDFDKAKGFGPEPDPVFQDQSLTCTQTLLDTQEDAHVNTAWAIAHDVAHDHYVTEKQKAFLKTFLRP